MLMPSKHSQPTPTCNMPFMLCYSASHANDAFHPASSMSRSGKSYCGGAYSFCNRNPSTDQNLLNCTLEATTVDISDELGTFRDNGSRADRCTSSSIAISDKHRQNVLHYWDAVNNISLKVVLVVLCPLPPALLDAMLEALQLH